MNLNGGLTELQGRDDGEGEEERAVTEGLVSQDSSLKVGQDVARSYLSFLNMAKSAREKGR